MKIKKNIALSDSGFVFNPSSGDSYSTNPIGIEIITLLKDGKSDEEIKNHIVSKYQTDGDSFERDFYDFIKMLGQFKLIENDGEEKA